MIEKIFEFEDNSKLKVEILEDGSMSVLLQARHLGKDFKFTSASVILSQDNAVDLVNWLGENLVNIIESQGESK